MLLANNKIHHRSGQLRTTDIRTKQEPVGHHSLTDIAALVVLCLVRRIMDKREIFWKTVGDSNFGLFWGVLGVCVLGVGCCVCVCVLWVCVWVCVSVCLGVCVCVWVCLCVVVCVCVCVWLCVCVYVCVCEWGCRYNITRGKISELKKNPHRCLSWSLWPLWFWFPKPF